MGQDLSGRARHLRFSGRELVLACCVASPWAAYGWWSNGESVPALGTTGAAAQVVQDGKAGLVAVWFSGDSLIAQRLDGDGVRQWSGNVPLTPGKPNAAAVAGDRLGGCFLLYRSAGVSPALYAQHVDAGGVARWNGGVHVATGSSLEFLDVIADTAGGMVAVFADVPTYLIRLDQQGRITYGRGVPWSQNVHPPVISDGAGGIVYSAWGKIARISETGETLWDTSHPPNYVDLSGASHALVASSDFAAFTLVSCDESFIYLQRCSANGTPQWASEVRLGQFNETVLGRVVAVDGGDGVLVAWKSTGGVRAQRIGADGATQWGDSGVLISPPYAGAEVKALGDGTGGMYLLYSHAQPGMPTHVFLQRVSVSGGLLLGGGIPVSETNAAQVPVGLASWGSEGVIAAWREGSGLYANVMPLRPLEEPQVRTAIRYRQAFRVEGGASQGVVYNYSTGARDMSGVIYGSGAITYNISPGEWLGLFLYDYESGSFSQAEYCASERPL